MSVDRHGTRLCRHALGWEFVLIQIGGRAAVTATGSIWICNKRARETLSLLVPGLGENLGVLPATGAKPCASWLRLKVDTGPMKPLEWTIRIITGHHIAKTDVLAQAILPIVASLLVFRVDHLLVIIRTMSLLLKKRGS